MQMMSTCDDEEKIGRGRADVEVGVDVAIVRGVFLEIMGREEVNMSHPLQRALLYRGGAYTQHAVHSMQQVDTRTQTALACRFIALLDFDLFK